MPSLRRTFSSPSVRSSPYSNSAAVARGNGRRRSSGSETTNRRVLADIEWWKVTDGQCNPDADQESEDRNRGDQDIISLEVPLGLGIHITQANDGVEHPLPTPLPWISSFTTSSIEVHFSCPAQTSNLNFLFFISMPCPQQSSSQLYRLPHTRRHTGITLSNHRPPLWRRHLSSRALPSSALISGYWT